MDNTIIAGGIILASIPYFLIKGGYKLLKQDEFKWIGLTDKVVGFALIIMGLLFAFVLVVA